VADQALTLTVAVPPPVRLSAPQTVFAGISGLVTATVTINNFAVNILETESVTFWVDNSCGLLISELLRNEWTVLTTAICSSGNGGLSQAGVAARGARRDRLRR